MCVCVRVMPFPTLFFCQCTLQFPDVFPQYQYCPFVGFVRQTMISDDNNRERTAIFVDIFYITWSCLSLGKEAY